MSRLTEFGINFEEVIKAYAQIDAYSQVVCNPKKTDCKKNQNFHPFSSPRLSEGHY